MLQLHPIAVAVNPIFQLFFGAVRDEYGNQIMINLPHGFSIIIFLTL